MEALSINSQEDHDSLFLTVRVGTAMQNNVIMFQIKNYDNKRKFHYQKNRKYNFVDNCMKIK